MDTRSVTIYDIAREAGVSPATVSRVLTNSANVKKEKKDHIEELIKKYNFKPSAVARSLSDTRRNIIGIIAADVRNIFYADVYVACEIAADQLGYTVLLLNSFGRRDIEKKQLGKLMEQRVDAIIHLGGAADDMVSDKGYVEQVKAVPAGVPFVTTGKLDGTQCYSVQIDARRAMDILLEHLVSNGNKRIALVGGRYDVLSTHIKYDRFMERSEEYGLEESKEYTDNWGSYNSIEGQKTMDRLFNRLKRKKLPLPEAVIAINDNTAVGVIKSIRQHGLRIPEDISVAGYDNINVAEIVEPNVTSIEYGYDKFGQMLVQTAIDAINGKTVPKQQYVEPDIVVRKSSDFNRLR